MPGEFTGENVNRLLALTREISDVGDVQLSLLAIAFITACRSCGVDRAVAEACLADAWSRPFELIPIPHLNN